MGIIATTNGTTIPTYPTTGTSSTTSALTSAANNIYTTTIAYTVSRLLTTTVVNQDDNFFKTTGGHIYDKDAEIDRSFSAALDKVTSFEPDRNLSSVKQIGVLEELGQDVLTEISKTVYQFNINENTDDSQLEAEDLANVLERTAKIVDQITKHVPEEGELHLKTFGIAAVAKDISKNDVNQPISLNVYDLKRFNGTDCKGRDKGSNCHTIKPTPSVTMSPSVLKQFPPGGKIISITYIGNEQDGAETKAEIVDMRKRHEKRNVGSKNNQTEIEVNNTTTLASGMITIRLTVNGSTWYTEMDIDIPIQKSNKTLVSNDEIRQKEVPVCASWNTENKIFTNEGCYTTHTNGEAVTSHVVPSKGITSFAILLQIQEEKISVVHQQVLGMLTIIFSSASIVALAATVLVLLAFESLRKSERNIIHMNLAMSLFAAQLLFLVAVDKNNNEIMCNIIAMLLHYMFLSVFGWMLVGGLNLYFKIVKVYGAEKNRLPFYFGIGWGMPVPIVIISAGIRYYSYTAINRCWLNTANGLIWAFAGPVIFVFLVNAILLCVIGRILFRSSSFRNDQKTMIGIRTSIRGALVLTPHLGTPWILGLFATGAAVLPFQYLFVIVNSLQGVFIFGIYCLFNQEVRSVVKKSLRRRQLNTIVPLDQMQSSISATVQTVDTEKPMDEEEKARRREKALIFWTKLIDEIDDT